MISKAIKFASKAHQHQIRKYSGELYIVHPMAVAGLVASVPCTDDMIAAAILHDVIEDCGHNVETLSQEFNMNIGALVAQLTDVSVRKDVCRRKRKEKDREHTAKTSRQAKTIKLADVINNLSSMTDPSFAKVYFAEKRELLKILTDGDPKLFMIANSIINEYYCNN